MELLDVLSHHLWIIVGYLGVAFAVSSASVLAQTPPGSEIYKQHCAECHGENGEGVKGKYDDPLEGNRTIDSLTRYIDRYMPEDKPELLDTAQARQVAEYVSATFYAKRSESNAAGHQKISFVRLTNRQFRESVADLIGSFDCTSAPGDGSGLHAEYFQSDGMDKKAKKAFERRDLALEFDFAEAGPSNDIDPKQFAISWNGSLFASTKSWYEIRADTPNASEFISISLMIPHSSMVG
ncbi:MAG: cytochrome c [Akkermansiaceae bacterium]|nr:cytochrome c [Akkermansiaceae bacterium]